MRRPVAPLLLASLLAVGAASHAIAGERSGPADPARPGAPATDAPWCPRGVFGIGGYLGLSGVGASATIGDIAAMETGQRARILFIDPATGAVAGGTGYGPSAFEAQMAALDATSKAAGGADLPCGGGGDDQGERPRRTDPVVAAQQQRIPAAPLGRRNTMPPATARSGGDTVEHVLKRTERSWIARIVTTSVPELVETETDYLLTVGGSQPAFLVLTTPNAAGAEDPGRVMRLIGVARRQHRLVFQIGRAIVLAFNGAWGHPALVDNLAALLARHQLGGPVPTLLPRPRLRSGLRALHAWLRALATPQEPERTAPSATERAPVAAIQSPTGHEGASAQPVAQLGDPVVAVMPGQGMDSA